MHAFIASIDFVISWGGPASLDLQITLWPQVWRQCQDNRDKLPVTPVDVFHLLLPLSISIQYHVESIRSASGSTAREELYPINKL
jgi:hypothetical protein